MSKSLFSWVDAKLKLRIDIFFKKYKKDCDTFYFIRFLILNSEEVGFLFRTFQEKKLSQHFSFKCRIKQRFTVFDLSVIMKKIF
jgi:coproporphyrinogen III oxidase